jgi:hypothetical protein
MARAGFFAIHSSCWQNRKNAPQQQGGGEGGIWTCVPLARLFLMILTGEMWAKTMV